MSSGIARSPWSIVLFLGEVIKHGINPISQVQAKYLRRRLAPRRLHWFYSPRDWVPALPLDAFGQIVKNFTMNGTVT